MENTLENKLRFFAQYWGQEVGLQQEGGGSGFKYDINEATITECKNDLLLLKPLSAISDEDAVDLLSLDLKGIFENQFSLREICRFDTGVEMKFKYKHPDSKRNNADGFSYCATGFSFGSLNVRQYQFAVSRGYLYDFHDLSTEQITAYGWAKTA